MPKNFPGTALNRKFPETSGTNDPGDFWAYPVEILVLILFCLWRQKADMPAPEHRRQFDHLASSC